MEKYDMRVQVHILRYNKKEYFMKKNYNLSLKVT